MRDLQKYAAECMEELENIGIQYGNVTEFKVNTRAKSRWGLCKSANGNGFTIEISQFLLDETTDVNGLKNTIIHELLHTCKGCMNHGKEWKRLANKVNNIYGYNIKRVSSSEEKGCTCKPNKKDIVKHVKHKLICENCDHVFIRYKESNLSKYPEQYLCKCGGKITKIF